MSFCIDGDPLSASQARGSDAAQRVARASGAPLRPLRHAIPAEPAHVRRPAAAARAHLGCGGRRTTSSVLSLVDPTENQEEAIRATEEYCRRVVTVANPAYHAGRAAQEVAAARLAGLAAQLRVAGAQREARSGARWSRCSRTGYDVVHFELAPMAAYAAALRRARAARPDPVPRRAQHRIRHRAADGGVEASALRRAYSAIEWRKVRREERHAWTRLDGCTVTSVRDQEMLLADEPTARTAVVPNGVDLDFFRPSPQRAAEEPPTLLFFGAIDYYPNTDAMLFFLHDVLPQLARAIRSSAAEHRRPQAAREHPRPAERHGRGHRGRRRRPAVDRAGRGGHRPPAHRRRHASQDPRGDGDGQGRGLDDAGRRGARRRSGARPPDRGRRRRARRAGEPAARRSGARHGASGPRRGSSSSPATAGRRPSRGCRRSTASSWRRAGRPDDARGRASGRAARRRARTCSALDGVRGLAILMVLCVHFIGDAPAYTTLERAMVKLANYGIWGVDLFFVLSGFLITGILHDAKGSAALLPQLLRPADASHLPALLRRPGRALRRAARCCRRLLRRPWPSRPHHQAWLWLYASNVYLAIHRAWALPYVSHFWSLAVEEQFYLVWPVVVLSFGRRSLLGICVAVTVLALVLRSALSLAGAGDVAQVVLTPCRFDALCVGGFLALAVRSVGLERVARTGRRALGPLVGLVLLVSAWNAARGSARGRRAAPPRDARRAHLRRAAGREPRRAGRGHVLGRVFRSRVMCFLGTCSYGLYVFHGIIAYGMWEHRGRHRGAEREDRLRARPWSSRRASGPVSRSLVAAASYELFEKHFLRLKNRLAPSRATQLATVPLAAESAE